jgi:uncharacterized protein (DUF983 family)
LPLRPHRIDLYDQKGDDDAAASRILVSAAHDSAPQDEPRAEPDTTQKSAPLLLWRAVRRRCPNCGQAGVFNGYFALKPRCPRCGMMLERGEGDYFLGAYALNLVGVEVILAIAFVIVMTVTWPNPPWTALQYGGAALAVVVPIVRYPFTKTIWLALDLIFRPPKREDFIIRTK